MTINLDKIKQRMNKLQNKGGNGDDRFWRPQDGEQTIRIVPTSDGDPFKDFWFHYRVGDATPFLSPKRNFGEQDALDTFVRKLFDEGSEDSIKVAKSLMARQRFFSPVIVRGEEDKGVRIWGYGKMAYEKLLSLVLNPEYGDISDSEAGTDLVLHYGKPAGATFPQTKITPRRKSTPLSEDSAQSKRYLESIPDFDALFERKTPEEVEAILQAYLSGESSTPANGSSETVKYKSASDDTSDVEAAFKDLLGS